MKKVILLFVTGFTVFFWGCTNMAPETIEDDSVNTGCTPQFPEMDVTYDNYVKKIVTRYCIECHYGGNSPGPGDFTTYKGLKAYIGNSFYFMVIQDQADMPPGNAPLPKSMRDSLNIWIQNCAPEK
ncbi:MAG: hypothetical protein WC384_07735 [Prolixibacteraceae bacterium]